MFVLFLLPHSIFYRPLADVSYSVSLFHPFSFNISSNSQILQICFPDPEEDQFLYDAECHFYPHFFKKTFSMFTFSIFWYSEHPSAESHNFCLNFPLHLWKNCSAFTAIQKIDMTSQSISMFIVSKQIFQFLSTFLCFWKASSSTISL